MSIDWQGLAAATAVLGVIGGAIWQVIKIARRIEIGMEDLTGTPERPGVPARKGIMERLRDHDLRFDQLDQQIGTVAVEVTQHTGALAAIDNRVSGIEHEMSPNSGQSMRDTMDRIEAGMQVAPPTVQTATPHRRR